MEASRDGPFQLISVKIVFDIQVESYSYSSWEFNWCQYFDTSVLMQFNMGIEIGDGRGRPLQLISLEFFEHFWMTNSHVFCGN